LRKFATANKALYLVLIKKSEPNLNNKDMLPQVYMDLFKQATFFILHEKKPV